MMELLNLVVDGQITTQEQAANLLAEEATEMAAYQNISVEEARTKLLEDISRVSRYLSHKQADNLIELFQAKPQPKESD